MSDSLDIYRERGLDDYQMNEVRLGFEHGKLTADQVDLYAQREYDHLQMKEIREALEDGLAEGAIQVFLNPEIDYLAMNHARTKLMQTNAVDQRARAKLIAGWLKIVLIVMVIGILGTAAWFGSGYMKSYLAVKNENLYITLKSSEITVNCGDPVNPADYVTDYTKSDTAELELPESIDTSVPGQYTLLYTIRNSQKSVDETMIVDVTDQEAPLITLNTKEVTLTRGEDTFQWKSYLSSAADEIDGDLTDKVTCSTPDESRDDQEVTYTVADASGNVADTVLTLHYKDPETEQTAEPEVVYVYQSTGGSSAASESYDYGSGSAASQDSGSSSNYYVDSNDHGTQYFMFSDGYDMDTSMSACVVAGKAHGNYSCNPIMSDGLYTGVELTY